MIKEHVHHMPVLHEGKVVGMVSRHDFLKIFGASTQDPST
jgi:CBS domain-containing protein